MQFFIALLVIILVIFISRSNKYKKGKSEIDKISKNDTKEGFNFVAIDFETANSNLNSACSIGIVEVKDSRIVNTYYTLIKPPILSFDKINMELTGLSEDAVKDAPTFKEVWQKIKKYFNGDYLLTAYNASFDMRVLKSCLDEYNIEFPDFKFFCAMNLATHVCDTPKKSLQCRCDYFGIDLNNAHNALCDTKACAEVVLNVLKLKNSLESFNSILSIKEFSNTKADAQSTFGNKPYAAKVNIKDVTPSIPVENTNNPFYNKNVVFTGTLGSISRKDAMQKVVDAGGILKSGVSKKIDYLIYGEQNKKIVGDDCLSSKQKRAMELIEQGFDIKIIDESQFLELINEG